MKRIPGLALVVAVALLATAVAWPRLAAGQENPQVEQGVWTPAGTSHPAGLLREADARLRLALDAAQGGQWERARAALSAYIETLEQAGPPPNRPVVQQLAPRHARALARILEAGGRDLESWFLDAVRARPLLPPVLATVLQAGANGRLPVLALLWLEHQVQVTERRLAELEARLERARVELGDRASEVAARRLRLLEIELEMAAKSREKVRLRLEMLLDAPVRARL
ncbi:MAG: hypothetical protein AB1445_11110 [Bacillota bacterium]